MKLLQKLRTFMKQGLCKTRVLTSEKTIVMQVRWFALPYWFTLEGFVREKINYESEEWEELYDEEQNCQAELKQMAANYARDARGYYVGAQDYVPLRKHYRNFMLKHFVGADGVPGAQGPKGNTGAMGMMGPAYDDIKCPHCGTYRSHIWPRVPLRLIDHGEGKPLEYICLQPDCEKSSNWIAYNGLFLHEDTIVQSSDLSTARS